jgi:hypothetical protein|tara:strand:+ start:20 stop:265 length:246 start_codon:yes stop_codon:yes gene_type:complete
MTKTLKPMEMLNDCHAEWRQSSMKKLIEETKNTEGKGLESIPYCGAMISQEYLNSYHDQVITPLILSLLEIINNLENQCKK